MERDVDRNARGRHHAATPGAQGHPDRHWRDAEQAIAALEDDNEALHGVLKGNINFNEQVAGKPKIKNDDLKDLLDHFTKSVDGQGVRW